MIIKHSIAQVEVLKAEKVPEWAQTSKEAGGAKAEDLEALAANLIDDFTDEQDEDVEEEDGDQENC